MDEGLLGHDDTLADTWEDDGGNDGADEASWTDGEQQDEEATSAPFEIEVSNGEATVGGALPKGVLQCDPSNPLLPFNPETKGQGRLATLVSATGFLVLLCTLLASAKISSWSAGAFVPTLLMRVRQAYTEQPCSLAFAAEDSLEDLEHPHDADEKKFFWGSAAAFVVSLLTAGLLSFLGGAVVLQDLVFERLRSSWLAIVNLVGLLLFVLFFASAMLPTKLGSGSLCRETFFAHPHLSSDNMHLIFRSSASDIMCMLMLLFYARFILISLCNSEWQAWKPPTYLAYGLALFTCVATGCRLYSDLQYWCGFASQL